MGFSSNIDVAEILFTLFWLFFAGLIFYLRREDKREGYPLESDRNGRIDVQGFPAVPRPKTFKLAHGGTSRAPRKEPPAPALAAKPVAPYPGAPLVPTGDPLVDGIGPASYAPRADTPDLTFYGEKRVVPLRALPDFHVDSHDRDPRGMPVVSGDKQTVGLVEDIWVDRSEPQIYYLEAARDTSEGRHRYLVPFGFADLRNGRVVVDALFAEQFRNIPQLKSPDEITLLEEDKICAYFAGGTLYAEPARQEALI